MSKAQVRTELESDGRVAIVFLEVNPRVSKQNSIGVGQDEVKRGAAMCVLGGEQTRHELGVNLTNMR